MLMEKFIARKIMKVTVFSQNVFLSQYDLHTPNSLVVFISKF